MSASTTTTATNRLIGSIDQGTSSSRFTLYDENGRVVASAQRQFDLITPQPGWAEQDPHILLQTVRDCISDALTQLPASAERCIAVGVTNQRETTVVWERSTGRPLHNAVVWLDTRTADVVDCVSAEVGGVDALRAQCGLPLATYFSALKLRWLHENVASVRAAMDDNTCMVGTVDSWLIWNLTGGVEGGVHVTDVTNASRTMLMDLRSGQWSDELCKHFKVNKQVLPQIKSSAEKYGTFAAGPLKGVALAGCLGDQQAALVGHRCFEKGLAKNTYGTGCFMLLNTGKEPQQSKNGLLSTVAYQLGPNAPIYYALEGSIAVAGAAVNWLIDSLKLVKDVRELNELAESVEDTGDVYFVPALSGLFAPHWRDDARGVIVGLTQFTNRAHICRALLEAVCFQTREVLLAMNADSGVAMIRLKVDGGMTKSELLMQAQADLLNIVVERPQNRETTSLGAAFAAGLAMGVWKDEAHLNKIFESTEPPTTFQPNKAKTALIDARMSRWNDAVQRSFGWQKTDS